MIEPQPGERVLADPELGDLVKITKGSLKGQAGHISRVRFLGCLGDHRIFRVGVTLMGDTGFTELPASFIEICAAGA